MTVAKYFSFFESYFCIGLTIQHGFMPGLQFWAEIAILYNFYFSCLNCHYNSSGKPNYYGKSCRWSKGPLPTGRPLGRRSRRHRINLTATVFAPIVTLVVVGTNRPRRNGEKCSLLTSFLHFLSDFSCLLPK